jgi:biopolymer transport protein ExbB
LTIDWESPFLHSDSTARHGEKTPAQKAETSRFDPMPISVPSAGGQDWFLLLEKREMSVFLKFVTEEFYFAIPLFLMSITGVTLVVWRILLNNNAKTDMSAFLPAFQQKLDRDGIEGALKFCRSRQDLIPRRLFVAGLETSKQGMAAMRRAMANAIELEILPDLNFLLPTILAIAKIATMVGLLLTVISMINTFTKIQQSIEEGGNASSSSGAIGLALFATAFGLITAIPLVFSHVLFKAWINQFELKMKSAAQKLQLLVQNAKQGGAGAGKSLTDSSMISRR